ncbi:MAG: DNA polymerase III subunit delta [Bryobacterales bacterium]|nr:DNA polymerase III subunit delta [Bryobacteraceae bacterium]MDW8356156.1 DNA polymerase III subunit delta [Bryobacterales bacterium]
MRPEQFLAHIARQAPAPAYLFLGAEPYRRRLCRDALIERVLTPEGREDGFVRRDLEETPMAAILDDARSFSLFAPRRLIWVRGAEAVLPRGRSEEDTPMAGSELLAAYLKAPPPDVVIVFDAARYELDGEDKAKTEKVRKFYAPVKAQVEFPPFSAGEIRALAAELATKAGLRLAPDALEALAEAVGNDALRLAGEIDKLALFAADGRTIGATDLAVLVPDSRLASVFSLVEALGRGERTRALELLDTLLRQGEYLPLALSFLATHFRLALTAREAGLRSPEQVQARLSSPGRPIWPARARQILETARHFSSDQLASLLQRIFEADRALRDVRPDERVVVEALIFSV